MKKKWSIPGWQELSERLGKYKYALLIALLGVILLLWSSAAPEAEEVSEPPPSDADNEERSMEQALQEAISQIEGAGEACVVLSWQDDGEVVYQTDTSSSGMGESTSSEQTTVTIQSGSSQQQALVVQTRSPTCMGALVVCEGADSAAVRLSIVSAVAALTGLGSDQITVVKMKS